MAALDPAILAWALTLPSSNRWRGLAEAFAGGTTRVSFEGRSIEYRSLAEISTALAVGYAAENSSARRPTITLVRFSREGAG
jgi:hypothetical protein